MVDLFQRAEAAAPHLVVIVANGITGDSRVQKTALAAARAGWRVTLLGAGGRDGRRRETVMGPVRVIRLPVPAVYATRSKGHPVRRLLTQTGIPNQEGLAGMRAAHQVWLRRTTARIGRLRTADGPVAAVGKPLSKALGAMVRGRRAVHRLRVRAFRWEQRRTGRPTGNWRRDWPPLADLDLAFGPVIEELRPDLVHANDITMIHTAALSVARMRAHGARVAWLYDAHEYVPGIDSWKPAESRAYRTVERTFIRGADAVVTVSPEIAEMLRDDYRLPETPLVVRNTPIREAVGASDPKPSVRANCGLADDVPLLVYSGWLAPERGLGTAVTALPALPGVHLAIVSGRDTPERQRLLERAEDLGVADRVHVVPYVPQHAVPDYLSTADLGLICSQRTLNYELSLPTKLAEYLHAGVPVVASNVRTLGAFVREHGVGEVFTPDDPVTFADAVHKALGRKRVIPEPVLADLSWERQVAGLIDLYARIAPRAPEAPNPGVSWSVHETTAPKPMVSKPGALPAWRPLNPASRVRLGLGPANYAGQMATFAQAICRDLPDVSAEVFMRHDRQTMLFPADVYVETQRQDELSVQLEQAQRIVERYTHLIVDAFLPVFGHLNGETIEGDLPALRRAGIAVALVGHGSEIRHPGRHLKRYEYSLFHDAPERLIKRWTIRADRNRRIAEESGLPLFVTTPDLIDDLPGAAWAPLVADVDAWASDAPILERVHPRVLHAPSQRWTKGTERILPTLRALHDRGAIELVLAEGVSWPDMQEMIKTCDIVVDQFALPTYGNFAVEAMAAGRPVVGCVDERVHAATGVMPPIVNASPATLAETLESLIDDPSRTVKIGMDSALYAREIHDGRRTAQVLAGFTSS